MGRVLLGARSQLNHRPDPYIEPGNWRTGNSTILLGTGFNTFPHRALHRDRDWPTRAGRGVIDISAGRFRHRPGAGDFLGRRTWGCAGPLTVFEAYVTRLQAYLRVSLSHDLPVDGAVGAHPALAVTALGKWVD